jgi:hypothetical protein
MRNNFNSVIDQDTIKTAYDLYVSGQITQDQLIQLVKDLSK